MSSGQEKSITFSNLSRLGVIGAGQMGAGIAQVCAAAGLKTILWDRSEDALSKGYSGIGARLDQALVKGKITAEQVALTKSALSKGSSLNDYAECDRPKMERTSLYDRQS